MPPAAMAKQAAAQPALLRESYYQTVDGAVLPLRRWLPVSQTKAVLIALHGFNDYSHFFEQPARYLSSQGIACFAYDQRGFGMAPLRGQWAGAEVYGDDLRGLVRLIKQQYPHTPLYLLGESMGGAVIISATAQAPLPEVQGSILSAPAVWARSTMPWYQSGLLWLLDNTAPKLRLTGRGVRVKPSDNIAMLRALGRDPLVIKATRVDALSGLSDLMDKAFANSQNLPGKSLLLYGEKDDLIPKKPMHQFLQGYLSSDKTTGATADRTAAIYANGYHMLLRDLQAPTVWQDIAAWIAQPDRALPSAADTRARAVLTR